MESETQQNESLPERLFRRGIRNLVSIIPKGATLSSESKIRPENLGKIPGRKRNGVWSGYKWTVAPAPTIEDLRGWLNEGASIGLRADSHPGLDIDCLDEVLAARIEKFALEKLGPAPVRVGRAPKRLLMYRTTDAFSAIRLRLKATNGQKHLVELLGAGSQYVIHGTHASTGRPYEWQSDPAAAELTIIGRGDAVAFFDQLTVELTAEGYEVAAEGGGNSSSSDARAQIDQATLRAPSIERLREAVKVTPNETTRTEYIQMAVAIKAAAGADFEEEGFAIFAEWADKWTGGVNNPEVASSDWRGLRAPFGLGWDYVVHHARDGGFSDVDDYLGVVVDPATVPAVDVTPAHIARFNKRYALVETTANVVLHTPEKGGIELMPHQHWSRIVANDCRFVSGGEGKPQKSVAIGSEWLKHPNRRTVVRLVCDPTLDPLTVVPSKTRAGRIDFNLWPGLALKPSIDGTCDLFLAHLLNIVCAGNVELYRWLLMWLAGMVQQPGRLPGTAAAMRGVQGSGKSFVAECMAVILGAPLHVTVDGVEGLTGRFNARLESKVLLQAEEAFFAGDKKNVGRLKTLITAPTLTIERKNVDAYDVANLTHLLITSNENWIVPAELGERRYVMFDVSPDRAHDWSYFGPLRRQMFEEGGCARLLQYLLHDVTVDWEKIARPLATAALRDQQLQSLDVEHRWLLDLLNGGALPGDEGGNGCALTTLLYSNYSDFMKSHGAGLRASDIALGRLLADHGVGKDRRSNGRKYRYTFPPLAECRAKFARGLAAAPEWDEYEGWQPTAPLFAEAL